MDSFERAAGYLPADLRELLRKIPPALRLEIQEIRLRADAPLIRRGNGPCPEPGR